jgi:hypothetical protein
MMDLYAKGSTLRLAQSYMPTTVLNLGDEGFTYHNAALLIALLVRGQESDLTRANVLGKLCLWPGARHGGRRARP